MTAVGKIFKPELRVDSVRRFVCRTVNDAIGEEPAGIKVSTGGRRGMSVNVTLRDADVSLRSTVERTFEGYNFELTVT